MPIYDQMLSVTVTAESAEHADEIFEELRGIQLESGQILSIEPGAGDSVGDGDWNHTGFVQITAAGLSDARVQAANLELDRDDVGIEPDGDPEAEEGSDEEEGADGEDHDPYLGI